VIKIYEFEAMSKIGNVLQFWRRDYF
jgi:hypothetical protein